MKTAGVIVVAENAANLHHRSPPSAATGAIRFRRVVPGAGLTGAQQNLKHLRITRRAPPCEDVEHCEQYASSREAVEQIERRSADQQRKEEEASLHAAYC